MLWGTLTRCWWHHDKGGHRRGSRRDGVDQVLLEHRGELDGSTDFTCYNQAVTFNGRGNTDMPLWISLNWAVRSALRL